MVLIDHDRAQQVAAAAAAQVATNDAWATTTAHATTTAATTATASRIKSTVGSSHAQARLVGWLVRRARKVRDRSHCCTKANDNHHAGSGLRLPEVGGRLNSTFILRSSSDGSSKLRRGIKSLPLHVPFHCLLACLPAAKVRHCLRLTIVIF